MNYRFKKSTSSLTMQALITIMIVVTIGLSRLAFSDSLENTKDRLKHLEILIVERFHELEIDELTPSPVKGIYELISGGQIFYISEDANHLFTGALIDTTTRLDLTAARKNKVHLSLINELSDKDMLIYEPETPVQGTVTVFTDTSCPYCSRLHSELDLLLNEGIRVRYLMFPRAGLGSKTHKELESVWCAKNPHQAMTNAKAGESIPTASCNNPIEAHVAIANSINLKGTPLIYLDDGRSIAGYRPANDLIALIKE